MAVSYRRPLQLLIHRRRFQQLNQSRSGLQPIIGQPVTLMNPLAQPHPSDGGGTIPQSDREGPPKVGR